MKSKKTSLVLLFAALFWTVDGVAQQNAADIPDDWFLRDAQQDKLQGMSVEKAYQLLQNKPARTVVVAVIDSGVDIDHEDLKDVLWVNRNEIPDNGVDDDKNGYVDDVNGWNFIGGKGGDVDNDTNELTREYKRLKQQFGTVDPAHLSKADKENFDLWKKVEAQYEREAKHNENQLRLFTEQFATYSRSYQIIAFSDSLLRRRLGVESLDKKSLERIQTLNDTIANARALLLRISQNIDDDQTITDYLRDLEFDIKTLQESREESRIAVAYVYNTNYDSRKIIGDNYEDKKQKFYGNNHVAGGRPKHGTHVAGVIAANRLNNIGMKGVADHVKIMAVRVVPPAGDERDKDVANAIYYAVDNGAQIINMSFGKAFSRDKAVVDKAIKYAESKNVLIVHASGNDGDNNDVEPNFPSRFYLDRTENKYWLEVGASAWGADDRLVASFSNYGKKSVDVFAPGVEIYATDTGNKYSRVQGTSFASPAVSGVAAILMSYFPDLTVKQVRDIIKQSTRKFDGLKVTKPGTADRVPFSQLSNTGGIVDAYEAVKTAVAFKGINVE